MSRLSIGVVEFTDLRSNTKTQIAITRIPKSNMTYIFLAGVGDVEVGLDKENAKRLLGIVKRAITMVQNENSSWANVGEADFTWSDHADRSESGVDQGTVTIESNGTASRLVVRTKKWDWTPYVTTFGSDSLKKLADLLLNAIRQF